MPQKLNFVFSIVIVAGLVLGASSPFGTSSLKITSGKNGIFTANAKSVAVSQQLYLPLISKPVKPAWPMAGANSQRTSWTSEEVRGHLKPLWFKPFEPYISQKVQIIAAYNSLYISTARGLYALDATTGAEHWVYPTELPLGHSPTIHKGVAYVGGFDHKLHAVDAHTGQALWTFEAGAGFDTNPLVAEGKVFAGNRDGYFYSIYVEGPNTGQLAWKYQTEGPIHYSAAYNGGVIFFASDDSHAYALNAEDGGLVWKSSKLPGAGFHSWWPVIYRDWVVFAGSENYRNASGPGPGGLINLLQQETFPNKAVDPRGTLIGPLGSEPGDWVSGTPTVDTSRSEITENGSTYPITEYLEAMPWRRTFFVLDKSTGKEYTTDFDSDGKPEFAPVLWFGIRGGSRYPPIVGGDGVLYQTNHYMSSPNINGGQITGWKVGSPFISIISSDWGAVDEPHAYSAGGDVIYWKLCCDRQAGAFDISIPNTKFADRYTAGIRPPTGGGDAGYPKRDWSYYSYHLDDQIPGYNIMTYVWNPYSDVAGGVYGGRNGIYGWHGDESPPVPYNGRVYTINSNAVVAFAPQVDQVASLSLAQTVEVQDATVPTISIDELGDRLAEEVSKILFAGHLRPGYMTSGLFDQKGKVCGDDLIDYWHNPGDIIFTLIRALPHLPADLQLKARAYIQTEFENYPPYEYNHVGWRDGTQREIFDLPPEVEDDLKDYPPESGNNLFPGWHLSPHSFYVLWKYAEVFGGAKNIFDSSKNKLEPVPPNDLLIEMPHVHNAYIAGYLGYLELEKLAGYPESSTIRLELARLLSLRVNSFSGDAPDTFFEDKSKYYCRSLNVSRNFVHLVPELGEYLHDNAYDKVYQAISEYERVAPYWFVSKAEVMFGEGVIQPLYDYHALFQAKALILQEPYPELAKFLDIPSVDIGDLFYIQNLVSLIEANSTNN